MKREGIAPTWAAQALSVALAVGMGLCSCSGRPQRNDTPTEEKTSVAEAKTVRDVNVYIENSASMYGYVQGVTEFESIIYNYLTNIKISKTAKNLNLFYVNSQIIKHGDNIEDFIQKLEPSTFRQRGGNLGTTDISNLLKMILSETDSNTVSIVVSDFIFSPGRGRNAQEYLVNQQIGIKNNMATYLNDHQDAAVCIYQFFSRFEGRYYNREDRPVQINGQRPFYVWVIGRQANVRLLREKVDPKFADDLRNSYVVEGQGKKVAFSIVPGRYCRTKRGNTNACTVEKDHSGRTAVTMDLDLSETAMDDSYLLDTGNWNTSDPDMSVREVKRISSANYTHRITLTSERVKGQTLSVWLETRVPQWVEESNDSEGVDIRQGDSMEKTYGLRHLVKGVFEAFTFEGSKRFEMTLDINK